MKKLVSRNTDERLEKIKMNINGMAYLNMFCFRGSFILIFCLIIASCEDPGEPLDSGTRMVYRIIGFSVAAALVPLIRNYFRDLKRNNEPEELNEKFQKKGFLEIKTTDGKILCIQRTLDTGYTYGDKVFIDDQPAPDGMYKIGFESYITIENGKIKYF